MVAASELDGIRNAISKLDENTRAVTKRIIAETWDKGPDVVRQALMEQLPDIMSAACSVSSEMAAATYDEWRVRQLGETMGAKAVDTKVAGRIAAAINTAVSAPTANLAVNILAGRIGYEVRNAYSATMFGNAKAECSEPMPKRQGRRYSKPKSSDAKAYRSKPRFARIPTGTETCDFCLMLASRGFVYVNGEDGVKVHNHAHCQCVYVVQWGDNPAVEGYDPSECYDKWQDTIKTQAEQSAERNGTTVGDEMAKIKQRYKDAAIRAEERAKENESKV